MLDALHLLQPTHDLKTPRVTYAMFVPGFRCNLGKAFYGSEAFPFTRPLTTVAGQGSLLRSALIFAQRLANLGDWPP